MKKITAGLIALLICQCIACSSTYAQEELKGPIISPNMRELSEINKAIIAKQDLIVSDNFQSPSKLVVNADYTDSKKIFNILQNHNFSNDLNMAETPINEQLTIDRIAFHKIGKETYSLPTVVNGSLGKIILTDVKCITVNDHYELIKDGSNVIYQFNNTYLYFIDEKTNELIGNINYINKRVGSIGDEYKTISINPEYKNQTHTIAQNSLSISPNPAKANFALTIFLTACSNTTIEIFNMSGEIVKTIFNNKYLTQGEHTYTVNISDLPANTYFVKLLANEYSVSQKLIIN